MTAQSKTILRRLLLLVVMTLVLVGCNNRDAELLAEREALIQVIEESVVEAGFAEPTIYQVESLYGGRFVTDCERVEFGTDAFIAEPGCEATAEAIVDNQLEAQRPVTLDSNGRWIVGADIARERAISRNEKPLVNVTRIESDCGTITNEVEDWKAWVTRNFDGVLVIPVVTSSVTPHWGTEFIDETAWSAMTEGDCVNDLVATLTWADGSKYIPASHTVVGLNEVLTTNIDRSIPLSGEPEFVAGSE